MNEILRRREQMPPGSFLTSSIKSFLFGYSPFSWAAENCLGTFYILIARQSELCDKLRFRSQNFGTFESRVASAYVPKFFRITFVTGHDFFYGAVVANVAAKAAAFLLLFSLSFCVWFFISFFCCECIYLQLCARHVKHVPRLWISVRGSSPLTSMSLF